MGGSRVIRRAANAAVLAGSQSVDAMSSRFAPRPATIGRARPAVEGLVDEWELAGGSEEEMDLFDEMNMMASPRTLVFGLAPTIEEAKEATLDLKDTLDKEYFSPTAPKVSHLETEDSVHLKTSDSDASVSESQQIFSAAPDHIIQAFTLLRESPEAQDVVASLASDQNVWNAVMENEKVIEFYKKHQTTVLPSESGATTSESDTGDEDAEESMAQSGTHTSQESFRCRGFIDLTQNIKLLVLDMVNNMSDIFQGLGRTSIGSRCSVGTQTDTVTADTNYLFGSSFIALAIASIFVIIFRRS